ncbi:MAG: hypothetical protein CMK59_12700, partial [Proteobacteria bacterium]|nr:hypothetical protein [Pseudomonadota bacterium]
MTVSDLEKKQTPSTFNIDAKKSSDTTSSSNESDLTYKANTEDDSSDQNPQHRAEDSSEQISEQENESSFFEDLLEQKIELRNSPGSDVWLGLHPLSLFINLIPEFWMLIRGLWPLLLVL